MQKVPHSPFSHHILTISYRFLMETSIWYVYLHTKFQLCWEGVMLEKNVIVIKYLY